MTLLTEAIHHWREALSANFTVTTLKTAIIVWCILIILLVLFFVDNKWLLAGILLYEVMP